jgi:predicted nucleic acid-binding protein
VNLYGDTSWWFAYKIRADKHHKSALAVFDQISDARVVWTPWQRVEVFNAFRQAERASLLAPNQARPIIRSIEEEVRLGYWPHREFSWTDAVRKACDISAGNSHMLIRGMDLFHVAIAAELRVGGFLTFDSDQAALAAAAALSVIPLS